MKVVVCQNCSGFRGCCRGERPPLTIKIPGQTHYNTIDASDCAPKFKVASALNREPSIFFHLRLVLAESFWARHYFYDVPGPGLELLPLILSAMPFNL